ncbi:unnamed protein product [Arctogadus glacialis]
MDQPDSSCWPETSVGHKNSCWPEPSVDHKNSCWPETSVEHTKGCFPEPSVDHSKGCCPVCSTQMSNLSDLYKVRSLRKDRLIMAEATHPLFFELFLLPSGRRYKLPLRTG